LVLRDSQAVESGIIFRIGRKIFGDVVFLEGCFGFETIKAEGLTELAMREFVLAIEFYQHGFFGGLVEIADVAAKILLDVGGQFDSHGHGITSFGVNHIASL